MSVILGFVFGEEIELFAAAVLKVLRQRIEDLFYFLIVIMMPILIMK